MEDGVATVCFATGMAAIGALMLALLREGDHVVASQFLFGNTVSQFNTLAAHGADVTFVDATDVANVERALTPATRLVFVETIANPRTQVADLARIGALCAAARHSLHRRQHDDLAVRCSGRRRCGAGLVDQRADQVHRRPRQRARAAASPTPASSTGRAIPTSPRTTRRSRRALWGIPQIRKKGLRDWGGTLSAGAGAPHRGRRRDARAADGAHVRQRAGARAISRRASAGARPSTTRACRRIRSTRSRARCSARFGGLFAFELADGIDCFDFLNRLDIVVSSSNLGDNRTLAIPVAHTIFWEMGAGAPRGNGHRRSADPRLGRHRGSRRPDRRFRAGAGDAARRRG